ncbi:ArsR family transcriptional regulator [Cohnella endophytica]|uniref:ArsR family transcriptional regulator n=1 Tax=Cohnella endophytica TaxID=2419778 RepID=A0A494Y0M6_9BACL|nr:helix-turn-helix transcriptional regulator [Cohnella endophytica]RKP53902.1 ArsR family transcriptional regulator [Cohnella endophytica]
MAVASRDASFEVAYGEWMAGHTRKSSGERKRKLTKGLNHAQKSFIAKVWWPNFFSFNALHPEYEVTDFKDGFRYLDFAWAMPGINVAIEIDGFGPHWRNVDRWKFADNLFRQNHLVLDGWIVLRFSYDDIAEHPRRCQQLLMHAAGKWGIDKSSVTLDIDDPVDRAIVAYAERNRSPFSPTSAAKELGWHRTTINRHIVGLTKSGYLNAASSGKKRTTRYVLGKGVK